MISASLLPGFPEVSDLVVRCFLLSGILAAIAHFSRGLSSLWRSRLLAASLLLLPLLVFFPSESSSWMEISVSSPSLPDHYAHYSGAALILAWALGSLWHTLRMIVGQIRLHRLRASSRPIAAPEELQMPARLLLLLSDQVVSPFATGWRKPAIFLSAEFESWERDKQLAVLAHEHHHHQSGDLWVQLPLQLVAAIFWWNPLVWQLVRLWGEEREFLADEASLHFVSPRRYATDLLDLSIALSAHHHRLPTSALFIFRPGGLESRVTRMLAPQRRRSGLEKTLTLFMLSALMACIPACARWNPFDILVTTSPAEKQEAAIRLSADPFPAD